MVKAYAEILAMDDKALERVSQLIVRPNGIDPEGMSPPINLVGISEGGAPVIRSLGVRY